MNALSAGAAYPMFATHDRRPVRIVGERTRWYDRVPGFYEFLMLHGVQPGEQRRLAQEGETVRVYVPFGSQWSGQQWSGHPARRPAGRPADGVGGRDAVGTVGSPGTPGTGFSPRALASRS